MRVPARKIVEGLHDFCIVRVNENGERSGMKDCFMVVALDVDSKKMGNSVIEQHFISSLLRLN